MSYELIETIEVGSGGASSIEFTSIPQDGVDLLIQFSGASVETFTALQFNGDTSTSNYSRIYLRGSGTTVNTNSNTTAGYIGFNAATYSATHANTFGNAGIYVSNYTSGSAKSVSVDSVTEGNDTNQTYQVIAAGAWAGTSAITSLKIYQPSQNLVQYSTASLYKIY